MVRNADLENHFVEIGHERVAILVCHDLAVWSPRGNATRKGTRAKVGRAFDAALIAARPTRVLHLPHTLDKEETWRDAWSRLERSAGSELRSTTSSIRYLTKGWKTPVAGLDARLLEVTSSGERAIDIVVHDPGRWPDVAK